MATSSIFTHVKITDPKKVEMFAEALESSEKARVDKPSAPRIPVMKNLDEIRKLVSKRKTTE
ncbi:MAG: hypothetical protein E7387_03925 [Ruminococcaceae bacterium]|nr:hypothetical protein [Oscillospiraceae bacterium]